MQWVGPLTPDSVENPHVTYDSSRTWLSLIFCGILVQDFLQIPKSGVAQVPYIKWHRLMRMVGPPHPQTPNHG